MKGNKIMAFPAKIVESAWLRSYGEYECKRVNHGHGIHHWMRLNRDNRRKEGSGKREVYSVTGQYREELYDGVILRRGYYEKMR